jgi:hypothetical protein
MKHAVSPHSDISGRDPGMVNTKSNNLTAAIHCPLFELSTVTVLGRELFEAASPWRLSLSRFAPGTLRARAKAPLYSS